MSSASKSSLFLKSTGEEAWKKAEKIVFPAFDEIELTNSLEWRILYSYVWWASYSNH